MGNGLKDVREKSALPLQADWVSHVFYASWGPGIKPELRNKSSSFDCQDICPD